MLKFGIKPDGRNRENWGQLPGAKLNRLKRVSNPNWSHWRLLYSEGRNIKKLPKMYVKVMIAVKLFMYSSESPIYACLNFLSRS